ncbi:heavy-metal-associated domain-containing protein [Plantactinospora sp. B6F1]
MGRLPGVESVKVHFASARNVIVHDPAQVDTDALVAAVREAGYLARPAAF